MEEITPKTPEMGTAEHHLLEQRNTTEAIKNLLPAAEGALLKHHENGEKLGQIHDELKKRNEGPVISEMNGEAHMIIKAMKGDPGYTPEKGKDYYTDAERQAIIDEIIPEVTPVLGEDYYTEEQKKELADDVFNRVRVPADGYTPQKGVDYDDGEDADETMIEERLTEKLLPLIPKAEEIQKNIRVPKDGSPDTPAQIKDKLQSLPKGSRLDYEKLDNLPNIPGIVNKMRPLKPIASKDYATSEMTDVSMQGIVAGQVLQWDGTKFIPYTPAATAYTQVFGETPAGSGTAFTLANTPIAGTVRLYRGGAYQQAGVGNDYTISGLNITLGVSLVAGEVLLADYNY